MIFKSLPTYIVEESEYRDFSEYREKFSRKHVKEVMFKLSELVAQKISLLLKNSSGALIFDGWSKYRMDCLCIYASFIRNIPALEFGKTKTREEISVPLISITPIAGTNFSEDNENREATNFSATAHMRHFESIFYRILNINIHDWAVFLIEDNCALNQSIANLIEVPLIGCYNH